MHSHVSKYCQSMQTRLLFDRAVQTVHTGTLWGKSAHEVIIWSLKVFGFIFNSAWGAALPAPWLLKHHYPSSLHSNECPPGKEMCVKQGVEKVNLPGVCTTYNSMHVRIFGHTSAGLLAHLESSLCLAAGHKNNLCLHKVIQPLKGIFLGVCCSSAVPGPIYLIAKWFIITTGC